MVRHLFTRVLLSILLLLSQQVAMSHSVTHLPELNQLVAVDATAHSGSPDTFASDEQQCDLCLALDQFESPGSTVSLFSLDVAAAPVLSISPTLAFKRSRCVFQSRAPPKA